MLFKGGQDSVLKHKPEDTWPSREAGFGCQLRNPGYLHTIVIITSVILEGSTVFMTGSTSTVGSGIVLEILKAGYKIRVAVRNAEKGTQYSEANNTRYPGAFETVITPDLSKPGAMTAALQGCSGLVHRAGSFGHGKLDAAKGVVETVLELARSAANVPSVKRYTSSFNGATWPLTEPGYVSAATWNEAAVEAMHQPRKSAEFDWQRASDAYAACKVCAERALFDLVKEHKPGFVANTVVPTFDIVEIVVSPPWSSSYLILGIAEKDEYRAMIARSLLPQFMVPLVDDGLFHLAALEQEDVQNERIIAAGLAINFDDLVMVLNKLGCKDLPVSIPGDNATVGKTLHNSRFVELLKRYGKDGFDGLKVAMLRCLSSPAVFPSKALDRE